MIFQDDGEKHLFFSTKIFHYVWPVQETQPNFKINPVFFPILPRNYQVNDLFKNTHVEYDTGHSISLPTYNLAKPPNSV